MHCEWNWKEMQLAGRSGGNAECIRLAFEKMQRHSLIMLAGTLLLAGAAGGRSSANGQAVESDPPFKLAITANRVPGDPTKADFVHCEKTEVKSGTSFWLLVRRTNISGHRIDSFSKSRNLEVRDSKGNLLKPRPFDFNRGDGFGGGPAVLLGSREAYLEPGEWKESSETIRDSVDIAAPGTYTFQMIEPVSEETGAQVVKSNAITIVVTQ
jgi:hypothetical protein